MLLFIFQKPVTISPEDDVPENQRRILISCGIILLVICLCLSILSIVYAGTLLMG